MGKKTEDMSWHELTEAVRAMSEKEALELLDREKNGDRRKSYMLRLYGRYNVTRAQRERAAIVAWAAAPNHGGH